MTPSLKAAVVDHMHSSWIRNISLFEECPDSMLIRLSVTFTQALYPPGEVINIPGEEIENLMVINRGLMLMTPLNDFRSLRFEGNSAVYQNIAAALLWQEVLWQKDPRAGEGAATVTFLDVWQAR